MWQSPKQSMITSFNMEAEFVACFEITVYALWLHNYISDLWVVDIITKSKIYCDNSIEILLQKRQIFKRWQTYGVKELCVKEEVQKQGESIEPLRTELMIVNPLMKGLQQKLFKDHVHKMSIGCICECLSELNNMCFWYTLGFFLFLMMAYR